MPNELSLKSIYHYILNYYQSLPLSGGNKLQLHTTNQMSFQLFNIWTLPQTNRFRSIRKAPYLVKKEKSYIEKDRDLKIEYICEVTNVRIQVIFDKTIIYKVKINI